MSPSASDVSLFPSEFPWIPLVLIVVWRLVIPIASARKAWKKGYNYYLLAIFGIVVSPLTCFILCWLLPDRTEEAALRGRVAALESEVALLKRKVLCEAAGDAGGESSDCDA